MMRHLLKDILGWLSREYIAIYREGDRRLVDAIIQTNTQINQIILAVSVACLTAIATLNRQVFRISALLAFASMAIFIVVILLSVINLYLSIKALSDLQKQLSKSFFRLCFTDKMSRVPYVNIIERLSLTILCLFCLGLVTFLVLLGLYIFGAKL